MKPVVEKLVYQGHLPRNISLIYCSFRDSNQLLLMVNRRSAIRHMLCISAGALVLPSCMQDSSKSSIILKNLQVSSDQEKLLQELTETIIPSSTTPGAKDVYAHLFALKMLDHCYNKEDQQKYIRGMEEFGKRSKTDLGGSFVKASPASRQAFVGKLEADKTSKDDLSFFYATTKRLTIQAYTTSEYYLTKVQLYELIPARYHGCVPVKSQTTRPA